MSAALSDKHRTAISVLLLVLAAWDLILAGVALAAPHTWYGTIHGVAYTDPQGLFARTGAIWLAFAVFQFVAFLRWKEAPHWLVLVGGMRLGELIADWVYAGFAENLTTVGTVSLLATPVLNGFVCLFLIRAYFTATGARLHA